MNKKISTLLVTLMGAALSLPSGYADTKDWNAASGAWETGTNWDAVGVPATGDTVNITNGGSSSISSLVDSVNRLNLGGSTLSQLTISSGGSLTVTGNHLTRIGNGANTLGTLTVDGGLLDANGGAIYVGLAAGTTATLNVSNSGTAASTSNILMGTGSVSGVISTVNIGGTTTALAAGYISASSLHGYIGNDSVNNPNIAVVNFNHTSTRYTMTKGATSSDPTLLNNDLAVHAKAGVTVLTGGNSYNAGTQISSGSVLLANYETASATVSSTGTGAVTVDAGGVLGGVGYVLGAVTVSGTLKPGDYDYQRAVPLHGVLKLESDLTLNDGSFSAIALDGATRGTGYDALDIAGNLTLNGTLVMTLLSNFTITQDQTLNFNLFDAAGTYGGAFDSYVMPDDWNSLDLNWDTSALATTGVLSVTAVPEPSVSLLIVGAAAFLFHRRRVRNRVSV